MTTTVTVTAHAAKSSDGKQLTCVVETSWPNGESRTISIENGTTSSFSAYEGVSVTVKEIVLKKDE